MTYILAAGFFGLLYMVVRNVVSGIRESGRNDERANRAEKLVETTKKQTEEMLKERSVEDVARDLDSDSF